MNILVLNTSPKKKGGASRFFAKLLRGMLGGNRITTADICNPQDYDAALLLLEEADAVVISSPLYVDGIPAHMLGFLERAEQLCREKGCRFRLYVLSNSGFIEGCQNSLHMRMYEAWCHRAGVEFGGGVGIGGGVMLHALFVLFPLYVLLHAIQVIATLIADGGITGAELLSHGIDLLIIPIFFILPLGCMVLLAAAIRKRKTRNSIYTRALIPSFLFLPFADIFMLISALFARTLPHRLFAKTDLGEAVSETAARMVTVGEKCKDRV